MKICILAHLQVEMKLQITLKIQKTTIYTTKRIG